MQQDGVYSDMTSTIFAHGRSHSMSRYASSIAKGQNAYERQNHDEEEYEDYYNYQA